MERIPIGPEFPRLRNNAVAVVGSHCAEISLGTQKCSFEYPQDLAPVVGQFLDELASGGKTVEGYRESARPIADKIPHLLEAFDKLRLLVESDTCLPAGSRSGTQLYRDVRRIAERIATEQDGSTFHNALRDGWATREHLIGYALEYYWIVKVAPGLIGPALGNVSSEEEQRHLQEFLKSELGHDRFLRASLQAVGISDFEMSAHQPLPSTFALGASLGVYARQHPPSFKASLFLFERSQPAFMDAFEDCAIRLNLPKEFYSPMRRHADINEEHGHEDISRTLLQFDMALDGDTCAIVKRHVAILMETLIQQDAQIVSYYGRVRPNEVARLY